jgi:hypothetical protein
MHAFVILFVVLLATVNGFNINRLKDMDAGLYNPVTDQMDGGSDDEKLAFVKYFQNPVTQSEAGLFSSDGAPIREATWTGDQIQMAMTIEEFNNITLSGCGCVSEFVGQATAFGQHHMYTLFQFNALYGRKFPISIGQKQDVLRAMDKFVNTVSLLSIGSVNQSLFQTPMSGMVYGLFDQFIYGDKSTSAFDYPANTVQLEQLGNFVAYMSNLMKIAYPSNTADIDRMASEIGNVVVNGLSLNYPDNQLSLQVMRSTLNMHGDATYYAIQKKMDFVSIPAPKEEDIKEMADFLRMGLQTTQKIHVLMAAFKGILGLFAVGLGNHSDGLSECPNLSTCAMIDEYVELNSISKYIWRRHMSFLLDQATAAAIGNETMEIQYQRQALSICHEQSLVVGTMLSWLHKATNQQHPDNLWVRLDQLYYDLESSLSRQAFMLDTSFAHILPKPLSSAPYVFVSPPLPTATEDSLSRLQ